MLRHACGFKLANDGHDTRALQHYLGHKNIQHTVRYTDMAPDRFKDFWRDERGRRAEQADKIRDPTLPSNELIHRLAQRPRRRARPAR
jgi:integrase